MALLTPMTLGEARDLGRLYGVEVTGLFAIARGSVNSNFALELAGGGRAFLRVYEESDHGAVVAQNRLIRHLVAHGVPTPAPLERRDGGTVAEHAGKPVALFPFCEGDFLCQARVEEMHLAVVGRALATLHAAGETFEGAPPNRFGLGPLRARLDGLVAPPGELREAIALLRSQLERLAAEPAAVGDTVIHGDVFRDNVLWHDDGRLSAIVDFESASQGSAAFDLMVTMLAWCYRDSLDERLARALIEGYQAVRPLSDPERRACHREARAACVRFAITRITDYELRPRDVVVYKDYRRFLARLAEVEAMGPERFAELLGLTGTVVS